MRDETDVFSPMAGNAHTHQQSEAYRAGLEQDARLLKEAAETAEGFVTLEELETEYSNAHEYTCRCPDCLSYWIRHGPDPDTGEFGGFTPGEIADARAESETVAAVFGPPVLEDEAADAARFTGEIDDIPF